jgi:hypothetical protein
MHYTIFQFAAGRAAGADLHKFTGKYRSESKIRNKIAANGKRRSYLLNNFSVLIMNKK